MSPESLDQKPRIPQRNRTMRKRRTPDLTRQLPLQPTDLILQILRLLAHRALRRIRPDRLDRIPDNFHLPFQAIADYGEVGWQSAVVVDEQDVGVAFGGVAADVLGDDLAADRTPDVVDAVGSADFFGVVEGGGAVAVGDDEDVFGWEDFEGCGEGGADYVGGFVLGRACQRVVLQVRLLEGRACRCCYLHMGSAVLCW
jgi:hypothetical protein